MAYNITDALTLTSITGFNRSYGTTAEDYNRLVPLTPYTPSGIAALLFPGGVVTDPQTGSRTRSPASTTATPRARNTPRKSA